MRNVRILGSCLVIALFASACSRQSVIDGITDDSNARDTEASALDTTKTRAPEVYGLVSETEADKPDAEVVLAGALALAKSDDKNVFVHLGAPW